VSYQSRAKKRRYKAATKKAKKKAFRSSDTAKRWFLTIAKKDCCCDSCAVLLRRGRDIVYRHEPKEIRWWDSGHYLPAPAIDDTTDWLAERLR